MSTQTMKRILVAASALLLVNISPAAMVTTIKVTTTKDENGTNSSACSLREALHVINDKAKAPWGGCPAGGAVGDNVIQLKEGPYELRLGELVVLDSVTIAGKDTTVTDGDDDETTDAERNPYTGKAPYRTPPVTIIDGMGDYRIINTLGATGSSLTLKDLELRNGNAGYTSNQGNGGAIYAALSVALNNVVIRNSKAIGELDSSNPAAPVYRGGQGGAIFLSRNGASVSFNDVSLEDNEAQGTGGVLAMVCKENFAPATHNITIVNSLMAINTSVRGAGVIEACGDTTVQISASTLSANKSFVEAVADPLVADFAAITYFQTVSGLGSMTLTNLTAAKHETGPVLALSGVNTVSLSNSLFLGNDAGNCALATGISFPSGNYNSIDDTSCDALLIPVGTVGNANQYPAAGQIGNELVEDLALMGGLTKVHLLKSGSTKALNRGPTGEACTGTDQRGLSRKNGSACDIGAVERQEATPVDDTAENGTDSRVTVVDVLANDSFGEFGDTVATAGPNKYADLVIDNNAVVSDSVTPPGGTPRKICIWHDNNDSNEDYRNKLVVDNLGVITPEDEPIICSYKLRYIRNGETIVQTTATAATVKVSITNIAPKAVDDVYVRPLGQVELKLDILSNDKDADDPSPFDSALNRYPIYIASEPTLGKLVGESDYCPDYDPDSGEDAKICYSANLTYVSTNAQSPFADSFQYSVYDDDGRASPAALVTIKTNAPDPDKGETGGSVDLAGVLLLGLLGLRRARKL